MKQLVKIYKQNIYGIMGTLVFHILLVLTFLLSDIKMKGNVKEDSLFIEFPEVLPEEKPVEEVKKDNTKEDISAKDTKSRALTNVASNRTAKKHTTKSPDEFFDADYMKEVEAAKRLSADVSNQLSKKIVDINDIKMPVETTEGMNPDSIKNIIYTGESNIVYYLENRYHRSLPIPVYLSQQGGKVIVDIVVSRKGKVISAVPRKNSNISDEQIYFYAKAAALRTIFNTDMNAPKAQKGTIHYTFIAQ